MEVVLLAGRPVTPAPPLPTTPVARRAHLPVQVEFGFTVVEHHGELRAARVEVEPARVAVVNESVIFINYMSFIIHVINSKFANAKK